MSFAFILSLLFSRKLVQVNVIFCDKIISIFISLSSKIFNFNNSGTTLFAQRKSDFAFSNAISSNRLYRFLSLSSKIFNFNNSGTTYSAQRSFHFAFSNAVSSNCLYRFLSLSSKIFNFNNSGTINFAQ